MALKGMHRPETPAEVITRLSRPAPTGDCYVWLGGHSRGYAKLRYYEGDERLTARVARVVYELTRGPIPEGLEVDHLCHNRGCVNPHHLELVPHKENIRRQRAHRLETVFTCEKGHTLRVRANGTRFCYECKAEYQRQYRLGIRVRS